MARRTAKQWSGLVARWKRSGLSSKEFAAKAKVKEQSLRWWRWALGKKAQQGEIEPIAPVEHSPAFLPVRIVQRGASETTVPPPASREPVEIVVDARFVVRALPGFDETTMRRVLEILRDPEVG